MPGSDLPRLSGEVWSTLRAQDRVERVVGWLERGGPALVQLVLDVANRIGHGGLRTLRHAVGQLGAPHTLELSIAARLRPASGGGVELQDTWRHAVGAAVWARMIAAMRGTDPHRVFLGGLLHSVGRQAQLRTPGAPGSERGVCDAIVRSWRLPAPVAACVRHHRRFQRAPSFRDDVATVHVAVRMAASTGAGPDPRALTCLGLSAADLTVLKGRSGLVDAYVAALTGSQWCPCT